jgi:spore coat protein U-like protein
MFKRAELVFIVLLLLAPSQAQAGSCTISVTGLVFGSYNVFSSAPAASTGTISHSCKWQGWEVQQGQTFKITISAGQSGNHTARTMRNGADALTYNVFMDASATLIWGDGTGGTSDFTGLAKPGNNDDDLTLYGMIPAGQDVSAGTYADTLNVMIDY